MTSIADMAAKIQKIIDKANSTNSDAEAEMLMAKAHRLLEQHGIDLYELGRLNDDDPVGIDMDAVRMAPAEKWQPRLLHVVALYYGCDTVHSAGYTQGACKVESRMAIAGRQSARVTVEAMWPFIRQQVRNLGRQLAKQTGRGPATEVNRVANALTTRVHRLYTEQKGKNETSSRAVVTNALVPVDEIQLVKEQAFPGGLTKSKGGTIRTSADARRAAEKVSLYRQTGGRKQAAIGR